MSARHVTVVVAHPDDESYAFAGTLAHLASRGWKTRVVAMTPGDAGEDRSGTLRGHALGERRGAEFRASCAALGAESTLLDFPDAHLEEHEADAARALAPLLRDQDLVMTLGEDGGYGHRDHLACTRATFAASEGTLLHAAFPKGLFAPIHRALRRYVPLELSAEHLGTVREAVDHIVDVRPYRALKLASLGAHATQLRAGDPMSFLRDGWIAPLLDEEWFVHVRGPAVVL